MNFSDQVEEEIEKTTQSDPQHLTVERFFVAVILLAAANSWGTVFDQAFEYYTPRNKTHRVLMASVVFASLLTMVGLAFARHTYNNSKS